MAGGSEPAVVVDGVSKHFRLYHEKPHSLKERVIKAGRHGWEDFWALRDVSFEVGHGETVGLLGHNGSGKSTLLKCVAGILRPTSGRIATVGRTAALLELGAGFHPELTGRENVFLNASILGLPRADVERRFDDIVAFAELEQFIDNQVKHYSSGMYARLGFAVAVNVDPDVLLVDEVLSVGDEAFQRKCMDRIKSFQREGRTILFVTHAADLVRQICDRAVVFDHGRKVMEGPPGPAVRAFRETLLRRGLAAEAAEVGAEDEPAEASEGEPGPDHAGSITSSDAGTDGEPEDDGRGAPIPGQTSHRVNLRIRFTDVALEYPDPSLRYLLPGQPLRIRMAWEAREPTPDVVFAVEIHDLEGNRLLGVNTDVLGLDLDPLDGTGETVFELDTVSLLDGDYLVSLGIHDRALVEFDHRDQLDAFSVMNPGRMEGLVYFPTVATVATPARTWRSEEAAGVTAFVRKRVERARPGDGADDAPSTGSDAAGPAATSDGDGATESLAATDERAARAAGDAPAAAGGPVAQTQAGGAQTAEANVR